MSESSSLFTPPVIAAIGIGALAIYYLWKSSGNDHSQNSDPAPEPEKLERLPVGKLTVSELSKYDGKNGSRILVSVCGRIFDLTRSRDFYGYPDGPYNCFAGADASYMLGAMSLEKEHRNKKDIDQDTKDFEQTTLSDWIGRYCQKYPIVGRLDGFESVCADSWRESGNDDVIDSSLNISNVYDNKGLKGISTSELLETEQYNVDDCWIAVCGVVFNIKSADSVYENIYGDFPKAVGHDISVAVALQVFNEETYDRPVSVLKEDKQAMLRLKRTFSQFMETYPVAGLLKGDQYRLDMDSMSEEWDMVSNEANK